MRIAKESLPFLLPLLAASVLAGLWRPWAMAFPLVLTGFVLWFFRDPERNAPADPGAILSPADGRGLKADDGQVSIFLNLMNVHVCRSPVSGRVLSLVHRPGLFLAAFKDEASELDERITLDLQGESVRLRMTLVAGLIARRIVSWVGEGQWLEAGERVGIIRFGSRVDLELPQGSSVVVRVGDRVKAGQSVIGRLPGLHDS